MKIPKKIMPKGIKTLYINCVKSLMDSIDLIIKLFSHTDLLKGKIRKEKLVGMKFLREHFIL